MILSLMRPVFAQLNPGGRKPPGCSDVEIVRPEKPAVNQPQRGGM